MASWLEGLENEQDQARKEEDAARKARKAQAKQFYERYAADIERILQETVEYLNRRSGHSGWGLHRADPEADPDRFWWAVFRTDPFDSIVQLLVTSETFFGEKDKIHLQIITTSISDYRSISSKSLFKPSDFSIDLLKSKIVNVLRQRKL